MRRYGQFCPVAKTAEIFCQRWTPLIIRDLHWGSTRYSDLKRGVPLMSPTLLTQRLRQLEAEGIVERRPVPGGRGSTYHLTEAGKEFAPLIDAMGVWGQRWTRRELREDEIDMDLLIWGIESTARHDAFGRTPAVVQIDFTDRPAHLASWWFLNDDGRCQLCVDDPGHDLTLYLRATVADLIHVYRGDVTIASACDDGRLEVIGNSDDMAALGAWLNLSPLARVPPARP